MADEIIEELWTIKDEIAREHGYDIDTLVAHIQGSRHTNQEASPSLLGSVRYKTEADLLKPADEDWS